MWKGTLNIAIGTCSLLPSTIDALNALLPTADSFINTQPYHPHQQRRSDGSNTYYFFVICSHQKYSRCSIRINMAATGLSYQRLRNDCGDFDNEKEIEREIKARIRWSLRLKKVHIRKRLKMKIPSLRKFMRRKARLVTASLAKVMKRLKESQSHFGDLFAGNYLFMQVTPTPLKHLQANAPKKRIEDAFF
ncbi:hypothetical protein L1887_10178 [Cichorium endivia]|nr:hypothetical protein L1887_10178 [Cichorium endivia]